MNRNERTQQILTSAIKAAEEKGYLKFTREDVEQVAGVSGALIQYHFNTMEELRTAVREETIRTENVKISAQLIGWKPEFLRGFPTLRDKTLRYIEEVNV